MFPQQFPKMVKMVPSYVVICPFLSCMQRFTISKDAKPAPCPCASIPLRYFLLPLMFSYISHSPWPILSDELPSKKNY